MKTKKVYKIHLNETTLFEENGRIGKLAIAGSMFLTAYGWIFDLVSTTLIGIFLIALVLLHTIEIHEVVE